MSSRVTVRPITAQFAVLLFQQAAVVMLQVAKLVVLTLWVLRLVRGQTRQVEQR